MTQERERLRSVSSKKLIHMGVTLFVVVILASCESVKPYQRAYLNDREMTPGMGSTRKFQEQAHTFREGSSGGGSTKTSGGCGCN